MNRRGKKRRDMMRRDRRKIQRMMEEKDGETEMWDGMEGSIRGVGDSGREGKEKENNAQVLKRWKEEELEMTVERGH